MNKVAKNSRKETVLTWRTGFLFVCLLAAHTAYSDITTDGTVGTTINLSGSDYTISGGTQAGSNLFQSFGIFDVHTGETANFQGDASVARILGRVTGGTTSNIDGTLRSGISGADLYLINPAGVVFGANATLDVSGSFHVSTADYVSLGTDGRFDISTPANSVLTSSAPATFGFVSNTPAAITFNGSNLRVADEATLSVIGGDITITDTTLYARNGRVNIASAGSAGEVQLSGSGISMTGFSRQGDINVTQTTNVSGRPFDRGYTVANIDASGNGNGEIYIRGENFVADNGYIFADTHGSGTGGKVDIAMQNSIQLSNESSITVDTLSSSPGGTIAVTAKTIQLSSGSVIGSSTYGLGDAGSIRLDASERISISGTSDAADTRLFGNQVSDIRSETRTSGLGGSITITTPELDLSEGGRISVSTTRNGNAGTMNLNVSNLDVRSGAHLVSNSYGSGRGGQINIQASGTVTVTGITDPSDTDTASSIVANAFADGDGGRIDINAQQLVVSDSGLVQSSLTSSTAPVTASAGKISVQAQSVKLSGGGQIFSGNQSAGQGGDITLTLSDRLDISGSSSDGTRQSGVYSVAGKSGAGGTVDINVATLAMDQLGTINTSTTAAGNAGVIKVQAGNVDLKGGARVSSSTTGAGDGGQVTVSATGVINASGMGSDGFASGFYSDVQVPSGGQASDASGNGGNIKLTASAIKLSDQATVSAKSNGTGNAGSIDINAGAKLELLNAASIVTESSQSGGGRINIVARDLLHLKNSKISSSVADGTGNGGDITIDPEFVILDSSQILANADAGSGGNISITANFFIASPDSVVNASANTGIDGQVDIDSPTTDIIGSAEDLPESFLNAAALLKQRCAARAGGVSSSFVVVGTGGVPASPDGLLYTSAIPLAGSAQTGSIQSRSQNLETASSVFIRNSSAGEINVMPGCGT